MSSKIVKVTNGKILNYTIKANGYKTINGSQLITADTTISKNMVTEVDPNGVYSVGDRLGGIASFVCYFNSTDPDNNTDQKYAVFVLDASYRVLSTKWATSTNPGDFLPQYTNNALALEAKESATYNTNLMLNNVSSATIPAFTTASNASTVTVNGVTYSSQLPNIYELNEINTNKTALDTADPTVSDYSANSLATICTSGIWSSTFRGKLSGTSNRGAFYISNSAVGSTNVTGTFAIAPVFEIPVE